jgi:hypothetical protein
MVLAAAAPITAGFMIANMGAMVLNSTAAAIKRESVGTVEVSTVTFTNEGNVDAKPSPALVRAIAQIPGVARVRSFSYLFAATKSTGPIAVQALEGRPPDYDLLRGREDQVAFGRGEVVIAPGLARRDHVGPGGWLAVPGISGISRVRVQGIVANGDTTGLEVTMPFSLMERIWGPQTPLALQVDPNPGVSPAVLAGRIRAAHLDPHLTALEGKALTDSVKADNNRFFAPFWTLQRALIAVAFAAVLANLLLVAVRRKRELGLIAALGMSPRAMGEMIAAEALAIGVVAFILGSIAALAGTDAFRHALFIMIPFPTPFRVSVAAPFVYGSITIAVILLASMWPAMRTARMNIIEALRFE